MTHDSRRDATGLYATIAATIAICVLLGGALFRPRKSVDHFVPATGNAPEDNALLLDEPVEQIQR